MENPTGILIDMRAGQDFDRLQPAADCLKEGGVVIMPTETVYGIAAIAGNEAASRRLIEIKGRAPDKPFSLHVSDLAQIEAMQPRLSAGARRVLEAFMPGPLTAVLYCHKTGSKLGFRFPDCRLATELIRRVGHPVYATSANLSGRSPATRVEDMAGVAGKVDYIIDGGPTRVSVDSTVVDLDGERPLILRQGALEAARLEAVWSEA